MTYPLSDKWFLTAYDEIFINLQNDFFGQNRLFGAVGYNLSKNLSTQVGYLTNDFSVNTFDRFQIGFFVKTVLRMKKAALFFKANKKGDKEYISTKK